MFDMFLTILSSSIISGALCGLIIWATKTWISERLKESIKHEYDLKFQEFKSKLDLESEKQIIEFKNGIEKNLVIQAVANRSLGDVNKVSMDKKIQSIEAVWAAILALRTIFPPMATMIDMVPANDVDLYTTIKSSKDFDLIRGKANSDQFLKVMNEKITNIEIHRIYLGDYVWSLYHALMVIVLRFYMMIHFEQSDEKVVRWYEDNVVKGFVNSVLTPQELVQYEKNNFGRLSTIRDLLEKKIMLNLRKMISPEKITEESMIQAKKIEENIKELSQQYINPKI